MALCNGMRNSCTGEYLHAYHDITFPLVLALMIPPTTRGSHEDWLRDVLPTKVHQTLNFAGCIPLEVNTPYSGCDHVPLRLKYTVDCLNLSTVKYVQIFENKSRNTVLPTHKHLYNFISC